MRFECGDSWLKMAACYTMPVSVKMPVYRRSMRKIKKWWHWGNHSRAWRLSHGGNIYGVDQECKVWQRHNLESWVIVREAYCQLLVPKALSSYTLIVREETIPPHVTLPPLRAIHDAANPVVGLWFSTGSRHVRSSENNSLSSRVSRFLNGVSDVLTSEAWLFVLLEVCWRWGPRDGAVGFCWGFQRLNFLSGVRYGT
jgi:hypothetical protein